MNRLKPIMRYLIPTKLPFPHSPTLASVISQGSEGFKQKKYTNKSFQNIKEHDELFLKM